MFSQPRAVLRERAVPRLRAAMHAPALAERPPWLWFLAIGLAMAVGYFLLPSTRAQDIAYQVPETLGVVAVLAGVWLHRPADKRPWLILALGLGLSLAGDWAFVVLDDIYGTALFPSIADAFYLVGVGLQAVGLLLMVRGRVPGGDRAGFLDALIIAVGMSLVTWVFLMAPLTSDTTQSSEQIAIALAYPLTDVLLIGVLARLLLAPGRRVPAFYLILAALVATLVSDYVYAFLAVGDGYQTGMLVDAGWLIGFACWGAAALHPSMREIAAPAARTEARLSPQRVVVLAAASLMAPVVLVVQWAMGKPLDVPVIAGGSVLLFLLVLARLVGLVDDLHATLRQRKVLEDEMQRRALTDPLTGLGNRDLFADRLEHALAARDGRAAVLFIDLDDFKTVNDAYGHDAGDTVLRSVAGAIRRVLRPGDTAARLGGDEFAVLLEDGLDAYQAGLVAERVLAAIQTPTAIRAGEESRDYSIGASIGISLGANGSGNAQQLMREADIAMYVAKGQGKGRFTVFEPSTHAPVLRSLELRTDLDEAIRRRQFELHYQPIIDLATGELAGFEALARWRHPTRGLLSPAEFIPLAEATGAIVPLGRWILDEAVREAATWRGIGPGRDGAGHHRPPFVSVNLSVMQLAEASFADAVARLLASAGLAAEDLVLETTESARLDSETASGALRHLRLMGIRLAIDDFGTGYASLSQLRRVPFDLVKIDRSFVAALGSGARADSMVSGVVDLARRLNVLVVAEGIETADQLHRLREMGCLLGQGYLFAEPMSAADLRAHLGVSTVGARTLGAAPRSGSVSDRPRPAPAFVRAPLPAAD